MAGRGPGYPDAASARLGALQDEIRILTTEGRAKDAVVKAARHFTGSNFPYGIRQVQLNDLENALKDLDQVGQKT